MRKKSTIIVGAGPAGLGAAYALSKNNRDAVVLEKESQVGGICRTIERSGHRFDLGGHRFFTNIPEIERIWFNTLQRDFLKRPRLSRIYYNNKLFNYPLVLTDTLEKLGAAKSFLIAISYLKSQLKRKRNILTFQDYIIKNFGKKLFNTFFKQYTEKVWGIPCTRISADWARERITGLSMTSAITSALVFKQKPSIRTLIKEFYYPALGPGMMYEKIAQHIEQNNSTIKTMAEVVKIFHKDNRINSLLVKKGGNLLAEYQADDLISSMPITDLVQRMEPAPPQHVLDAAAKLSYRSLLIVNLICSERELFPDNWIYVHSPGVKLGRIQNYKNWSIKMVADAAKTSLGLEYFCTEGDAFWNKQDSEIINIAGDELKKIGIKATTGQGFVVRVNKAYPVYNIGYKKHIKTIADYLWGIDNLQAIGRCGRFRYDNMDQAMASGILAAKHIIGAQCKQQALYI